MKKTQKTLYLPLSDEALKWMPNRDDAKDTDKIFHLPYATYINVVLKTWAQNSGITKTITFITGSGNTFTTMSFHFRG